MKILRNKWVGLSLVTILLVGTGLFLYSKENKVEKVPIVVKLKTKSLTPTSILSPNEKIVDTYYIHATSQEEAEPVKIVLGDSTTERHITVAVGSFIDIYANNQVKIIPRITTALDKSILERPKFKYNMLYDQIDGFHVVKAGDATILIIQ